MLLPAIHRSISSEVHGVGPREISGLLTGLMDGTRDQKTRHEGGSSVVHWVGELGSAFTPPNQAESEQSRTQ